MKQILMMTCICIAHTLQSAATFSEFEQDKDLHDRPDTPLLFAGYPAKKSYFKHSPPKPARPVPLKPIIPSQKPSCWSAWCCLFFARKNLPQDDSSCTSPGALLDSSDNNK